MLHDHTIVHRLIVPRFLASSLPRFLASSLPRPRFPPSLLPSVVFQELVLGTSIGHWTGTAEGSSAGGPSQSKDSTTGHTLVKYTVPWSIHRLLVKVWGAEGDSCTRHPTNGSNGGGNGLYANPQGQSCYGATALAGTGGFAEGFLLVEPGETVELRLGSPGKGLGYGSSAAAAEDKDDQEGEDDTGRGAWRPLLATIGTRRARRNTTTVCYGGVLRLSCGHDMVMRLEDVFVGRRSRGVCAVGASTDALGRGCRSVPAERVVYRACDGEASCRVPVDAATLGADPCSDGTVLYAGYHIKAAANQSAAYPISVLGRHPAVSDRCWSDVPTLKVGQPHQRHPALAIVCCPSNASSSASSSSASSSSVSMGASYFGCVSSRDITNTTNATFASSQSTCKAAGIMLRSLAQLRNGAARIDAVLTRCPNSVVWSRDACAAGTDLVVDPLASPPKMYVHASFRCEASRPSTPADWGIRIGPDHSTVAAYEFDAVSDHYEPEVVVVPTGSLGDVM